MFEEMITTLAQKFGLGTNARSFVQMLLARISDPAHGGFAGFLQRLRDGGMGTAVDGWTMSPDTAASLSAPDLERAVGDRNLISDMTSRFGIDRAKVVSALGFAIPAIVSRVARGGVIPASLPAEAESFIGNRGAWAAGPTIAAVQAPARNWMPWIAAAVAVLLALGYCSTQKRSEPVVAATTPPVVAPPVPATETPPPAPEMEMVVPEGAAVVAIMANNNPALQVYFDVGKTAVSNEFKEKSAALIAHMNANPGVMAVISGFNDPTGDPAANAVLAKGRAEAVQQQLVDAGVAKERTMLEKPAETTGTATTNAGSRRVDVMLR
ncbi:MAG: OmpA family protein [Telluria sp.]